MRTNRLNICEALNFALAGHRVDAISTDVISGISAINGTVYIHMNATLEHPKKTKRQVNGTDFILLQTLQFNAGDDRTIKGYF